MALTLYTVILASATAANAPLTTDLAVDWTNNTEHVRQTVYDPDIHVPVIAHDHDGLNSKLVSIPVSVAMSVVLWTGIGGANDVNVIHPPSEKDFGFVLANPSVSQSSGVLILKAITAGDGDVFYRWTTSTRLLAFSTASGPDNPHLLHIKSASQLNQSGLRYAAYLFAEVVGICAIGTYTGDGNDDRQVDISDTSHSGQPDFQPDLVKVYRTNVTEDARMRTVDHAANTSSDIETGNLVTNGIKSFNANGFTLGTGAGNTAGGEYKYIAFRIGSGNGLNVEKVTSPQDATEQEVNYVSTTDFPFLAMAIETLGPSPSQGLHIGHAFNRIAGAADQLQGKQIDTGGAETDTQGIKQLGKISLRVGTAFPNSTAADNKNSNIWVFGASPLNVMNSGPAL